jgi:hypothetical protein
MAAIPGRLRLFQRQAAGVTTEPVHVGGGGTLDVSNFLHCEGA